MPPLPRQKAGRSRRQAGHLAGSRSAGPETPVNGRSAAGEGPGHQRLGCAAVPSGQPIPPFLPALVTAPFGWCKVLLQPVTGKDTVQGTWQGTPASWASTGTPATVRVQGRRRSDAAWTEGASGAGAGHQASRRSGSVRAALSAASPGGPCAGTHAGDCWGLGSRTNNTARSLRAVVGLQTRAQTTAEELRDHSVCGSSREPGAGAQGCLHRRHRASVTGRHWRGAGGKEAQHAQGHCDPRSQETVARPDHRGA